MKGDRIPDQDHVARLCKNLFFDQGKIQAPAFFLRPEEDILSVNWLEFFNCQGRENEIAALRLAYSNKNLNVKKNARIAVLNAGEVYRKVQREASVKRNFDILHDPIEDEDDPSNNDPSHSGIYGLRPNNEEIAELICETDPKIYPARS